MGGEAIDLDPAGFRALTSNVKGDTGSSASAPRSRRQALNAVPFIQPMEAVRHDDADGGSSGEAGMREGNSSASAKVFVSKIILAEHRGSEICGLGFNHWPANYRHPTGARFASARQPTQ